MGILGALRGAGRGLQEGADNYGALLREQKKMDWTAEQNRVQHEREMNLQRLRQQGQQALQASGQKFQASESKLGREATAQNIQERERLATERLQKGSDIRLDEAEKLYQMQKDKDHNERAESYEAFKSSQTFAGASEEEKEFYEMSFMHPNVAAIIVEANKKDPSIPVDKLFTAYLAEQNKGIEQFMLLPEKEQKKWEKRAKASGEDASNAYGSMRAKKVLQVANLLGGGETQGDSGINPAEINKIASDIRNNNQEAISVFPSLPLPVQQQITQVLGYDPSKREVTSALPKKDDSPGIKLGRTKHFGTLGDLRKNLRSPFSPGKSEVYDPENDDDSDY